MHLTKQIAKQVRDFHFGGNWTGSHMKEHLEDLDWKIATTPVSPLNTIALLVFHMNYYQNAVSLILQGNPLNSKHELSFDLPQIKSEQDWRNLLEKTWTDAEIFANLIEKMPEERLWEKISDKYGNYYENIQGVIEHNHYHLGQIVLLKKMLTGLYKDH